MKLAAVFLTLFVLVVALGLSGCQQEVQITPQSYILDKKVVTCTPYKATPYTTGSKEYVDIQYKCLFSYSTVVTKEEYKKQMNFKEMVKVNLIE